MKNGNRPENEDILVSIVIPGYNEAHRILPTLETLTAFCGRHFNRYEIVFVDDGSTDDTLSLVQGYGGCSTIKAMGHGRNRGKGYAVQRGMMAAGGAYRFFTDADLPYDTGSFLTALAVLSETDGDVVIGDRSLAESGISSGATWRRQVASRLFSAMTGRLLQFNLPDTQCGFKGFTADAARRIFNRTTLFGYAFDVEILMLARQMGLRIRRVPVTLVRNDATKIHLIRDGFFMFLDILRLYRRMTRPRAKGKEQRAENRER